MASGPIERLDAALRVLLGADTWVMLSVLYGRGSEPDIEQAVGDVESNGEVD